MSFEETELRLGLPGNNDNDNNNNVIIIRKRGFNEEADDDQQTILTVMPDLKLNLTSSPKYVLLHHLFSIYTLLYLSNSLFFLFVIP